MAVAAMMQSPTGRFLWVLLSIPASFAIEEVKASIFNPLEIIAR